MREISLIWESYWDIFLMHQGSVNNWERMYNFNVARKYLYVSYVKVEFNSERKISRYYQSIKPLQNFKKINTLKEKIESFVQYLLWYWPFFTLKGVFPLTYLILIRKYNLISCHNGHNDEVWKKKYILHFVLDTDKQFPKDIK